MTSPRHLDPGSNEELQFLEELGFDLGPFHLAHRASYWKNAGFPFRK